MLQGKILERHRKGVVKQSPFLFYNVPVFVSWYAGDVTEASTISGSLIVKSSEIEERHSAGTLTLTTEYSGFTTLNYIKCLATNISASNCTTSWVDGVSATGTFVKNANMEDWTTGNNGIPENWTVQDN